MTLLKARDLWVSPGQGGATKPRAPGDGQRDEAAVVRGLSLEVGAGEWVAVTGPNGGGKTTLLLALSGLWPIERGAIELDGHPILPGRRAVGTGSPAGAPARSGVAAILQDPSVQLLQPTVADELAFTATNLGHPSAEVEAARDRWAERLGLGPLLPRDPHTLSAGQQQLVILGAALVAAPRVLVADEPGAHLDAPTRRRVLVAVRSEAARGLGVVWATQDAEELAAADRVIRLGEGPLMPAGRDGPAESRSETRLVLRVSAAIPDSGPRVQTSVPMEIEVGSRGVTALTGPNGAGKSVILAAAAGWGPAAQVDVRWRGLPDPPPILASQYPELQLFEERVADEIAYAAVSRGLGREEALALAAGHLDTLGVKPEAFLRRRLWTLSGGEKRIAGLVGALVAPAGLRVLDEPTAGLDPGRRSALAGLLRRSSVSVPVLVATQDQAWMVALGARIFRLG